MKRFFFSFMLVWALFISIEPNVAKAETYAFSFAQIGQENDQKKYGCVEKICRFEINLVSPTLEVFPVTAVVKVDNSQISIKYFFKTLPLSTSPQGYRDFVMLSGNGEKRISIYLPSKSLQKSGSNNLRQELAINEPNTLLAELLLTVTENP